MTKTFHAFTNHYTGLARDLRTRIGVCAAFDPASVPVASHPAYQEFEAIWDTGATNSMISKDIVTKCGLSPFTKVWGTGVNSAGWRDAFMVNVALPNNVAIANVQVTEGEVNGGLALIGMDIITKGDFVITNVGGKTLFTFRVPSIESRDFVEDAKAAQGPAYQPFNFTRNRAKKKRR